MTDNRNPNDPDNYVHKTVAEIDLGTLGCLILLLVPVSFCLGAYGLVRLAWSLSHGDGFRFLTGVIVGFAVFVLDCFLVVNLDKSND